MNDKIALGGRVGLQRNKWFLLTKQNIRSIKSFKKLVDAIFKLSYISTSHQVPVN